MMKFCHEIPTSIALDIAPSLHELISGEGSIDGMRTAEKQ